MQINTMPALLRNAFTGCSQKNLHQDAHVFIFTIDCTDISTLFSPIPFFIPMQHSSNPEIPRLLQPAR